MMLWNPNGPAHHRYHHRYHHHHHYHHHYHHYRHHRHLTPSLRRRAAQFLFAQAGLHCTFIRPSCADGRGDSPRGWLFPFFFSPHRNLRAAKHGSRTFWPSYSLWWVVAGRGKLPTHLYIGKKVPCKQYLLALQARKGNVGAFTTPNTTTTTDRFISYHPIALLLHGT